MIEIEAVEWKNIFSYGDYTSRLDLSKLGLCFISGKVFDTEADAAGCDDDAVVRSNRAGKSSLINIILWALFGRTMHLASPGTKLVNWHTGRDCMAKVYLRNGDVITRTCKMAGHNELLVERQGESILNTLSTTKNQQAELARLYGLDWHNFCGTSFFTQYGRPWLETPDGQRKPVLERVFGTDRYTLYAVVEKEKMAGIDQSQATLRLQRDGIQNQINTLTHEIEKAKEAEATFDSSKKSRYESALLEAKRVRDVAATIVVPDLDGLAAAWQTFNDAATKIAAERRRLQSLQVERQTGNYRINDLKKQIAAWEAADGKICTQCQQTIPHEHVSGKIVPFQTELASLEAKANDLTATIAALDAKLTSAEAILQTRRPNATLDEARSQLSRRNDLNATTAKWVASAKLIVAETSPHQQTIQRLSERLGTLTAQLQSISDELSKADVLWRHHAYLFKSYNDRKRLKSFAMSKNLPYFNNRLAHYFDAFNLDLKLQLTESLAVKSDFWDYDLFCGGERRRADIALLLARFDVSERMHGRQCNIMVLDEVDGRLDEEGIDCLINIIRTELAPRVDTVLIVSHRHQMRDVFPHQVVIKRVGAFSHITEVR